MLALFTILISWRLTGVSSARNRLSRSDRVTEGSPEPRDAVHRRRHRSETHDRSPLAPATRRVGGGPARLMLAAQVVRFGGGELVRIFVERARDERPTPFRARTSGSRRNR